MEKLRKTIRIVCVATMLLLPTISLAGDLEPSGPPAPTMKTLDQIPPTWSQKITTGRFVDALGGEAVLDKETGLVWAKNANIAGITKPWQEAITYCRDLTIGGRKGWRLPSIEELASLVEPMRMYPPALPTGHPFTGVQSNYYWSSSEYEGDSGRAWYVHMEQGAVYYYYKSSLYYVWPVRADN
jgi:hypothetical protein